MQLNSLLFFHCFIIIYSSYKISGNNSHCWLPNYTRVSRKTSFTSCRDGHEISGIQCYPKCKSGYYGVLFVCWQYCPSNFADWGVTCAKPSAYGRGAGYFLESSCERDHSQGCVRWGLFFYPQCADNFHQVGCCICSPDCPDDMHDAGAFCTKKTYVRGFGDMLECNDYEEPGDFEMCYHKCKSGYSPSTEDKSVCLFDRCPKGYEKCGDLCLENLKCSEYTFKYEDVKDRPTCKYW